MTKESDERWSHRIDHVTEVVRRMTHGLTLDELSLRPDPGSWSIAQVLEHLIAVNTSYYPIFVRIQSGEYRAPWTASLPFLPNWLGKMILKSVMPENSRKTRTFPVWQPESGRVDPILVDRFVNSQEELKAYISQLSGRVLVINSPASSSIVYSLESAFDIIVAHEERHLEQLHGVLDQIKSQGT